MVDVMQGIRILEVAEHTFVPAASAVLADWGADVIKVEHAERGDAMRGLGRTGVMDLSQGPRAASHHQGHLGGSGHGFSGYAGVAGPSGWFSRSARGTAPGEGDL